MVEGWDYVGVVKRFSLDNHRDAGEASPSYATLDDGENSSAKTRSNSRRAPRAPGQRGSPQKGPRPGRTREAVEPAHERMLRDWVITRAKQVSYSCPPVLTAA